MESSLRDLGTYLRHTSQDSGPSSLNRCGKLTESMDFQQWRHQPSFHQPPRATNAGGEHRTRIRYIYGTPWTTKTDETRWKPFAHRTTGWYGKQRIRTGHRNYSRQALSKYSVWTKTQKRASGVTKSKDGFHCFLAFCDLDVSSSPPSWELHET